MEKLRKTYPNGTVALDDVTLTICEGMFGLLGPNGAGKSTLMRTIATLQAPDKGAIKFNGVDIFEDPMFLRRHLGYLPQEFGVYPRMSAERLLDYLAQLKGVSDSVERRKLIDYCLEITNLGEVQKKNVSGYSGGMKQRFGIAQLLLNNPQLIIVDEPTAGLDPSERQRFLNILREIGKEHIVIFSTHIVEDISELCTDMAILNTGALLVHGRPQEALSEMQGKVYIKDVSEEYFSQITPDISILSSSYTIDNQLRVRAYFDENPLPGFEEVSATLEDFYFRTLKTNTHV